MLFNTHIFLFLFLPLTLWGFFRLGCVSTGWAAGWLAVASLVFYGWWNPAYVLLLLVSIVFNYTLGMWIVHLRASGRRGKAAKYLLIGAIVSDLVLLGYYKYSNFFIANISGLFGQSVGISDIVLPLGISFYTFTQIAFLVDVYHGKAREYNFVHYVLFVTYFPHLIAGPILHHKEMMPQFEQPSTYRLNREDVAVGLTIFAIGLFKKVVLADGVSVYVGPVFDAAAQGKSLTFLEAWGGALAYTLQLYFDFSGYSDMAIGLSRLFGIKLPLNFDSPYKAVNIIEFWRRWHMTLSRFLRDYLYIALGGNRHGVVRRYMNLILTMLLGGLWHGAAWTFVVWGGIHGVYLIWNHAWNAVKVRYQIRTPKRVWFWQSCSIGLTFFAVVIGWVFFRAQNVDSAVAVLSGMAGANGVVLPKGWYGYFDSGMTNLILSTGIQFGDSGQFRGALQIAWITGLLAIVWFMPNTQQIMAHYSPALGRIDTYRGVLAGWIQWRPSWIWALATAVISGWSILDMTKVSEFLYFQF